MIKIHGFVDFKIETLQVYSSATFRRVAEDRDSEDRDGMQPLRCSIALIVVIHSP